MAPVELARRREHGNGVHPRNQEVEKSFVNCGSHRLAVR